MNNIIKSPPGKTQEKFLESLIKFYGIKPTDVHINIGSDNTYEAEFLINESIDPKIHLTLINNDLELKIDMLPGVNSEMMFTMDDIMERIQSLNVTQGLLRERIDEVYKFYLANVLIENVTIARGIKPIDGKNAEIIQHAKLPERKNTDENDRIDYKNIQRLINVKKGELLITKKLATKGVPGLTVTNIVIQPKEGKDIDIKVLEGVTTDAEGKKYYATQDGYMEFKNNTIAVYPLYTVREVNYATGNIKFNGTVYVKGDVLSGFEVNAARDILVDGICEDCVLNAQGDITVTGVKGKENNEFKANGNFTAKYLEGANVIVKGDITIKKYSYNSYLQSGGKIIATEGKGIIAGGSVKAYSYIEVNQFGAQGTPKFNISIGYKFDHESEITKVNQEIDRMEIILEKVNNVLSSLDLSNKTLLKNPKVVRMLKVNKELNDKITKAHLQLIELEKKYKFPDPKIKVYKKMFGNISVQFYQYKITIKNNLKDTLFFFDKKNERIGWVSLSETEDGLKLLND
jgi:uncharacterized protein (DUF342 family)